MYVCMEAYTTTATLSKHLHHLCTLRRYRICIGARSSFEWYQVLHMGSIRSGKIHAGGTATNQHILYTYIRGYFRFIEYLFFLELFVLLYVFLYVPTNLTQPKPNRISWRAAGRDKETTLNCRYKCIYIHTYIYTHLKLTLFRILFYLQNLRIHTYALNCHRSVRLPRKCRTFLSRSCPHCNGRSVSSVLPTALLTALQL